MQNSLIYQAIINDKPNPNIYYIITCPFIYLYIDKKANK